MMMEKVRRERQKDGIIPDIVTTFIDNAPKDKVKYKMVSCNHYACVSKTEVVLCVLGNE